MPSMCFNILRIEAKPNRMTTLLLEYIREQRSNQKSNQKTYTQVIVLNPNWPPSQIKLTIHVSRQRCLNGISCNRNFICKSQCWGMPPASISRKVRIIQHCVRRLWRCWLHAKLRQRRKARIHHDNNTQQIRRHHFVRHCIAMVNQYR